MARADERRRVADVGKWFRGEGTRVQLALLTVQLGYGGYYVLTKAAMSVGVKPFVFAVYRDVIALALMGPLAFMSERKLRPALTWTISLYILALGITGIFLQQLLFLTGLAYTNTSFAAAMQNAIPVFTFVIAVVTKVEKICITRPDGLAKLVGILAAASGAVVMCLYKGATIFGTDPDTASEPSQTNIDTSNNATGWLMGQLLDHGISYWQIGSICLVLNCLCMGIYTNLQVPALKLFPAPASLAASSISVGAVALLLTGISTITNSSEWVLHEPGTILSVLYAGAIASGLNFTLQTWANQRGGPVLLAAYIPLQTVISAFLGVIVLDDPLYVGSVIGAFLILLGLYLVIWGQRMHKTAEERLLLSVPFSGVDDVHQSLADPLLKPASPRPSSDNYGSISR